MQQIVRTLFRMRGRKGSQPVSSYSPAGRLSIAALAILCAGGLLSNSAAAQAPPQGLTTQAQLTHKLSPEMLAIHARLKRSAAIMPEDLELATSSPTNFNSEQGPGPARSVLVPGAMSSQPPHPSARPSHRRTLDRLLLPPIAVWSDRFNCWTPARLMSRPGPSPYRCIWAI
jgi:hypothetical protein